MAITTAVCNSFKSELLAMTPHAAGNTYKLILIKSSASRSYGADQTSVGESGTPTGVGTPSASLLGTDAVPASGTYGQTGFTLSGFSATLQSTTGCLDFASPSAATGTTISADGALIYNSSQTGRTLAVYQFSGNPIVSVGGNFTVTMPSVSASTSAIRIA